MMDTSYIMCIYMEDVHTGRSGPSAGKGLEHTMLPEMLDHIIRTFFPHIWKAPSGTLREVRLMQSFRQSSLRASLGSQLRGAHLKCSCFSMCVATAPMFWGQTSLLLAVLFVQAGRQDFLLQ